MGDKISLRNINRNLIVRSYKFSNMETLCLLWTIEMLWTIETMNNWDDVNEQKVQKCKAFGRLKS